MERLVVGAFAKNRTEFVAGELNEYNGKAYAHIRVYTAAVDGGLVPTKKGISVSPEQVSAVRDAVHRLQEVVAPNRLTGKIDVGRDQIRVGSREYEGNMYLDIRRFYHQDGDWKPTGKGVMVRPELLDQLISLIDQLWQATQEHLSSSMANGSGA